MKTHLKFMIVMSGVEIRTLQRFALKAPHEALRAEFTLLLRDAKKMARAQNIAYGFLRGRPLDKIEQPHRPYNEGHIAGKNQTRTAPDWDLVEAIIESETSGFPATDDIRYFTDAQDRAQKLAEFRSVDGTPAVAA